jgi:hypothetical protein
MSALGGNSSEVSSAGSGSNGSISGGSNATAVLEQQFKRELNRVVDADRLFRKNGLKKLLEAVPWKEEASREFVNAQVLGPVIACIKDSSEKCRELALQIVKEAIDNGLLAFDVHFAKLVQSLCSRINDTPFPETAEELRLSVVELLLSVIKSLRKSVSTATNNNGASLALMDTLLNDTVIKSVSKAITDNYPAVKKTSSELLFYIAKFWPECVRMSFSALLLKGLCANALHQHNKTRTATLKALGMCLACIQDDAVYLKDMTETVLQLLGRISADRSASTRAELANMCKTVLVQRIKRSSSSLSAVSVEANNLTAEEKKLENPDVQLLVLLLQLMRDEAPDVVTAATEVCCVPRLIFYHNAFVSRFLYCIVLYCIVLYCIVL